MKKFLLSLLFIVTLQFTDNATNETGFMVQVMKPDGTSRFDEFPPNPGTGIVTITMPNDGFGDCFAISAMNNGGMSGWTNRVCKTTPVAVKPASPTTASWK